MLRFFSGLLTLTWRGKTALTRARRLWCTLATDESTFEELEMLGGPVQWLDVKTIMAMLPEKVIQRKWLWRLKCLWYHSCLDNRTSSRQGTTRLLTSASSDVILLFTSASSDAIFFS